MLDEFVQQAVTAALNQNWDLAVDINREILRKSPKDMEALNRLGRAYLELGKMSLSRQAFNKVLKIDRYNQIALRNLKVLGSRKTPPACSKIPISPNLFLEEPGKTRAVNLVNLADKKVISSLCLGEEVNLVLKKRFVAVTDKNDTYLGKLTDDLSLRLTTLIKGGNRYQAHVKFTDTNEIKIFIREIYTTKKFASTPSFPPQEIAYQAFVSPSLIHESRPDIPEEEDETAPSDSEEEKEEEESGRFSDDDQSE